MNFAVLTGGGDSAGINDFLYFLAQRLEREGNTLTGFVNSWQGLVNNNAISLNKRELEKTRFTPGTILGTARKNPIKDNQMDVVLKNLEERKIDVLIAMGGDDTLGVASHLSELGVTVIGAPQTIDDDLQGTDRSLGFATSVNQSVNAINSLINSNVAHDRDMIVEVMGRDAGWLAMAIALNTPACACMCPEGPMELSEMITAMKRYKSDTGKASLAIVSEGIQLKGVERGDLPTDAFGNLAYEGVSHFVAAKYKEATNRSPRVQILGYLMRGGVPVWADVEIALGFANEAVDLALAGKSGQMVGLRQGKVGHTPLKDVIGVKKTMDVDYLEQQLKLLV